MKRLLIVLIIAATCVASIGFADGTSSLMLSDAEIQKLKKYFPDEDNEHVIWMGEPIAIQLPLGKEKRLIFSTPVTVDVKSSLTTSQLRLLNNDKSIYLTALSSFDKTRIYVTAFGSGKVILIDLTTSDSAGTRAQYIDIKENMAVIEKKPAIVKASMQIEARKNETQEEAGESDNVSYVDLIRFAWKEVYAPARLLKNTPHYARAAMHTDHFVSDLVYGDKVIAHPAASWSTANRYVTIVYLQNKYPHSTHIDIRKDLCGAWLAATLYPRSTLKAQGHRVGDGTTLFLVSQQPFGETLGVCHGDA